MALDDYKRVLGNLRVMYKRYTRMRKMVTIFIEHPELLPIKSCHAMPKLIKTMNENGLEVSRNTITTYMKELGIKRRTPEISDGHLRKLDNYRKLIMQTKEKLIKKHEELEMKDFELPIYV